MTPRRWSSLQVRSHIALSSQACHCLILHQGLIVCLQLPLAVMLWQTLCVQYSDCFNRLKLEWAQQLSRPSAVQPHCSAKLTGVSFQYQAITMHDFSLTLGGNDLLYPLA